MSVHKLMLIGTVMLSVVVFSPAFASAKQVHGPISDVIGEGEEGHTGGSGNGELAGPSGVAIDEVTGNVYVVDSGNNRVEKFSASGTYASQFSGALTPEGSFSGPTAVAVDQATGDVYVVDTGHNVVDKFNSEGTYQCELTGVGRGCQATPTEPSTFSVPIGVAVDPTTGKPSSGDVYVSDKENKSVDVFTELGADVTQFQPGPRPWGLAVDSAGHVYVALAGEERIQEYTAGGAQLIQRIPGGARTVGVDLKDGNIFVGAELGGVGGTYGIEEFDESIHELGSFGFGPMSDPGFASPGLTVNSTTKVVYAADTANNVVDMFGLVTIPDPTGCSVSAVTTTSATLHGEVNPHKTQAESFFQYGTTNSYGLETPLALVGGGAEVEAEIPVEANITGLTPGTIYHCRLDTTNGTGIFNDGPDSTFETPPPPPIVNESPAFATEITTNSAILNGVVNPGNGSTTYHFAYGLQAHAYTATLPGVNIGGGASPIAVEQAIPPPELKPNTTYHFVLTATNVSGTVVGADQTFTTASAGTSPESPPVVSTGPAESITPSSAILTGTVYPENTPTTYLFEAGTTTSYGTMLYGGEVGRERGAMPVAQVFDNLQPGVAFHYRVVAFNAAGTTVGPDRIFLTPNPPSGIVQPTTPQLLALPVFPAVKVPLPKPPKPSKKVKKHGKKKPKSHRAHSGRARSTRRR